MDNLNDFKIMLTAGITAVMGLLGWQGVLLIAWVVLMGLDYASGTWAAKRLGNWSSQAAREGVMHKGGMVLVVAAAGITDLVLFYLHDGIAENIAGALQTGAFDGVFGTVEMMLSQSYAECPLKVSPIK